MVNWSVTVPLLINTIVVSIPEQLFFVIFSLFLMRRYDFLEFKRSNVMRVAIAVIPAAFLSNILRGLLGMDMNFALLAGVITLFAVLVIVFRIRSAKGIFKAFLSTVLCFLVVLLTQLLYFPLILYGTSITAEQLNQYGPLVILLSLFDRAVQISILGILFLKKRSFMKLNFSKVITRNKTLAYLFGGVAAMNLTFVYVMCLLIYADRVLMGLEPVLQITIVVFTIAFPVINMAVLFGVINYSVNKHTHTRVYVQEESRVLRVLVKLLLLQKRYDEIDPEIESFENEVRKLK